MYNLFGILCFMEKISAILFLMFEGQASKIPLGRHFFLIQHTQIDLKTLFAHFLT